MTEIIEYEDKAGFRGWLAYDGRQSPLAAGGCRMRAGLTAAELSTLAGRMTLKQRVLGLNVDGAKCGIDLDPGEDGAQAALGRFLAFLGHELRHRFSMGPDMGTKWHELQQLAVQAGVPSIKYAIKTAQGLSSAEFFVRIGRLEDRVGPLTLAQRRAGHALAHAAIGAARAAGVTGQITCAMQGFGNLGQAVACSLAEENVRLTAVADEHGCVADPGGLDVAGMLRSSLRATVPQLLTPGLRLAPGELFHRPADVLILAACADAMSEQETASPPFATVVVGANCGLSEDAEQALHSRGIPVIPDFIGGIGGSASMEALFGPPQPPSAAQVLDNLAAMMRELVDDLVYTARRDGVAPRVAAAELAAHDSCDPAGAPYGRCRYLTATAR
ncbi:Glu/Leu/Phe/Val dehydrogenase dimerization domain-containing protein [Allorhizocola rhizosphaerae]|uniref:Glu/Leu/Phe/Val dehydrogenase dimerization domain-containing protein n=1 Tax=Allorhizocola rhizosphaerae TaxID=1872709 RepID=UPI000E3B9C70|nr:Glu/Leu/Phe/Val dehydrogenase dimerization domain-containing protein [Allorhizocola rhizosphaerae]